MTESNENLRTSGDEDSQATTASSVDSAVSNEQAEKDAVAYETHRRLLNQRKADQRRVQELEARLQKFEELERQKEQRKLEEEGEYKKILTSYEQKIQQYEAEKQEARRREVQKTKLEAFAAALPGKIKHPKYLAFVDTEEIVINPDSGNVDDLSLKNAVDAFLKEHSSLVQTEGPQASKIPAKSSGTPIFGEKMSKEDKLKEALIKSNML